MRLGVGMLITAVQQLCVGSDIADERLHEDLLLTVGLVREAACTQGVTATAIGSLYFLDTAQVASKAGLNDRSSSPSDRLWMSLTCITVCIALVAEQKCW